MLPPWETEIPKKVQALGRPKSLVSDILLPAVLEDGELEPVGELQVLLSKRSNVPSKSPFIVQNELLSISLGMR